MTVGAQRKAILARENLLRRSSNATGPSGLGASAPPLRGQRACEVPNVEPTPTSHLGWVLLDPGLEDAPDHLRAGGNIGLVAPERVDRLDHLPAQSKGEGFCIFFGGRHRILPF